VITSLTRLALVHSITPQFGKSDAHQKLLFNDAHTTVDLSDNCVMSPRGIAALCDWALLFPCFFGKLEQLPKTVFVHHLMLNHFIKHVLPVIPAHHNFILVSSGTDQTLPSARGDVRFKPMKGFSDSDGGGLNWQLLTNHPQIIHWYCENHDLNHPRVSTLPLGVVEDVEGMEHVDIMGAALAVEDRPLQFLVAHRVRTGMKQWKTRANVTAMCYKQQQDYTLRVALCVTPPFYSHLDHRRSINQDLYIYMAQHVPFILCVHGGGLDPSPKAWEAIMIGTIPIILHSTLDDAYSQLPVVFIDEWTRLFKDVTRVKQRLIELREKLRPYYSDTELRPQVLEVSVLSWSVLNTVVVLGVPLVHRCAVPL
jgi:hypothetical protein